MNIWVNGCFDILHSGHIDLLWFAKKFKNEKNTLFVGLDSDERVKEFKGKSRPINSLDSRYKIMSNLKMVDVVLVFDDDESLEDLIKTLNINYIIVGDQYKNKRVIGSEYAKNGVEFYSVNEYSTTNIIEKILDTKK